MKHLADLTRILFSISILALSASIAYFTYEVTRVRTALPELLTQLEQTTEIIEPVLKQTNEITQLIPPILEEVKKTRELIPPVIKEVAEIRKEIPAILNEVEQTRKIMPDILTEVELTRQQIPSILKEVELTRRQIPPILKEVKDTRESLPKLITDANDLVEKARSAGKEASQGAVSGFFSGIFRAPFAIAGDIGSTVFKLDKKEKDEYTKEHLNRLYQAGLNLLNSEQAGDTKEIISKNGKITTKITLKNIDDSGEYPCKTLHFYSVKDSKVISDKESTVCKNEEGKWDTGR